MNSYIAKHIKKALPRLRILFKAKAIPVLCCAVCALMLSGCSGAGAFLLHHSGALSDEDYQTYKELRDSGKLDNKMPASPPAGSIHVTFAENAYISVEYYSDANLKTPIDPSRCYMMPGDTIYASEPECRHPSSNWYRFDQFCVYSCNAEGNRTEEVPCEVSEGSPLAIHIPEGYEGTELAVVPEGKYETRQLELSDHYADSAGQMQELDGTWTINDVAVFSNALSVNPAATLIVDYQYDPNEYSFVSSKPSSFYHENGTVRFEAVKATEEITAFSIELRPLEGRFLFNPSNYSIKNGTVTFEYLDQVVTGPVYIPDGGILKYTADADSGYRCSNSSGRITVNVSDPDQTNKEIRESVMFYPVEKIQVRLPRPVGGTIEYTANGRLLTGDTCTLYAGTVVSMKFTNWNGWSKTTSEESYTVNGTKTGQAVSLKNGQEIEKVFTEAEKHKPTLEVILTNSVKENVTFDVAAPGVAKEEDLTYAGEDKASIFPDLLGQADRVIYSSKVGTYGRDSATNEPLGITLAAYNDTILSGSALKLDIVLKDTRGKKSKSVRYITGLPAEETIELYTEASVAASAVVYESVTITVSEVEVASYNAPSVGHATVRATLTDMSAPYTMKNGDVLEDSRNIEITLIPEDGYYIEGSKNDRGTYSETMKYTKWEKDGQKILDQHPAHKIWYVTLDSSDPYGTCVYKLDGTTVSGQIGIREGQKLTLEYTLTSSGKKIVRDGLGGSIGGVLRSKTKACTIPVSEALDGKTIQRSDYIEVE